MIDTPCEPWPGKHRKSDGRPMDGRRYAYRVKWERECGPLLPTEMLHHVCLHKWCMNLAHLKPLTQSDHLKEHKAGGDWGQKHKTHCPSDHEYTAENTRIVKRSDGTQERQCIMCSRAAKRRYRARLAAGKTA